MDCTSKLLGINSFLVDNIEMKIPSEREMNRAMILSGSLILYYSIVKWDFDRELTLENIERLHPIVVKHLTLGLQEQINRIEKAMPDIKHNLQVTVNLMENKDNKNNYSQIINSKLGQSLYCVNCEKNCSFEEYKTMPKQYLITRRILTYAYRNIEGTEYLLPGNWEDQPFWFNELVNYAVGLITKWRNDNGSREVNV